MDAARRESPPAGEHARGGARPVGWPIGRYLQLLIAVIALPLFGAVAYHSHDFSRARERAAADIALHLAMDTAASIRHFIDEQHRIAARLSGLPQIRAMDGASCDPLLRALHSALDRLVNISVRDRDGRFVCSARPLPAPAPVPTRHALDPALEGRSALSDPFLGALSKRWIVAAGHPVRDPSDRIAGAITLTIDLARVSLDFPIRPPYRGAVSTVVTGDGTIVARSLDPDPWIGKRAEEWPLLKAVAPGRRGTVVAPGLDGVERVYGVAPINEQGWRAIVGIPSSELLAETRKYLTVYFASTLAAFVLLVLAAFLIARRLAAPLQALEAALGSAGPALQPLPVPQRGPREVIVLARTLNRALAAEREIRERLAGIVDSAMDAVVTMDRDGQIVDFNPAAERIFGRRRGEAVGQELAELVVPPHLREAHRAGVKRLLATGESRLLGRRVEVEALRADGRTFPAELTITRTGSGEAPIFTGFIRDISERRRAEARLREQAERLRHLSHRLMEVEETERRGINRELHDRVGQHLSLLNLNLGRLHAKPQPPEDWREQIENARAITQTVIRLVRNVMADLRPPALDEYGLLAALRSHADTVARSSGLAIEIQGGDLSPRPPLAAETALYRIAQGALNNAAKHAGGSIVRVGLEHQDGIIRLTVEDDGRGFDPAAANPSRASWGLATMRERAEAIGARLRIESAPGRGTRVTVEWRQDPAA
jgi:PAS domain S-box-containing protein